MAARGSVTHALALALTTVSLAAAPAVAQEPVDPWEDPAAYDEQDDAWDGSADGGWDEPSDMAPPTDVPVTTVPVEPPPGVVLPAEPWEPPAPETPTLPVPKGKIIKGKRALVRADGKAAIPRGAPKRVRVAIAAANRIVGKPYKWGGGHARLVDSGYDCSGTVGFSLVHAGLMRGVMVSGQMARWAYGGGGRWITVYANKGHVYMEIAGLRLDTSPVGDPSGRMGVRWRPVIGRRPGFHARHPAGL